MVDAAPKHKRGSGGYRLDLERENMYGEMQCPGR